MRTIIYIDGFNLYFRLLKGNPEFKWLDVKALAENVLDPINQVIAVNYYTARVSGKLDTDAPRRQQIYFDALGTVPEVSIHYGKFLSSKKFAGLVQPPQFRPPTQIPQPWPDVVKIHKIEEKGSDVNLASHLLFDAFRNLYEIAVVLSNDSDLVEPVRIVTQDMGKVVGLLSPVTNPNPELVAASSFVRRIRQSHLAASQFPNPLPLDDGTLLSKPISWVSDIDSESI
ncbi:MAG: hypothetical protein RIR97_1870 [Pseudomonadota bacterium]